MFESVEDAYPAWIIQALTEHARETIGDAMTRIWSEGLCRDVKKAVAQPMLPLYLCYTGIVEVDVILTITMALNLNLNLIGGGCHRRRGGCHAR